MPEEDLNLEQSAPAAGSSQPQPHLARKLGLFDATMIVMGGIIGSGIFMNPYVVAQQVHTPFLILGAWGLGGLIALAGAFIYAELAERHGLTVVDARAPKEDVEAQVRALVEPLLGKLTR